METAIHDRRRQSGEVLGQLFFAGALVLGIFLEILYLTKDLGWRVDLTEEKLYSLSGSTSKVLGRLQEGLVIEAYFSKEVPGVHKVDRQKIVDMLDEYEQMGGGKVKLVFFDPLEDEAIREKASRLGITEAQATDVKDDSIQAVRFYQGLRIRYGGDRQKVLPIVQGANTIESQLTPVIRELVTERKPKVGFLVRNPLPPTNPFMRQRQPAAWTSCEEVIRGRYEIVSIDMSNGQWLPEDLDVLVVIQPKDLTDWEKYCIDQHLMRGGNMIVFADAADYSIDQFATFFRNPFQVDQPDTKLTWKKQLAAYGVQLSEKLVADMAQDARQLALIVRQGAGGQYGISQAWKPYWFNALAFPWTSRGSNKTFDPGIDTRHPILAGMKGLSFFWGTEVGLTETTPEGIEGKVLVRTSPIALVEDPPQSTAPGTQNPILRSRTAREARQVPLAVVVSGKFTSAWKGLETPKRPGQGEDKAGGLLAGGQGSEQKGETGTQGKEGGEAEKGAGQGGEAEQGTGQEGGNEAAKKQDAGGEAEAGGAKKQDAGGAAEAEGAKKQGTGGEAEGPKKDAASKQEGPAIGPQPPEADTEAKKEEKEKVPDRLEKSDNEGRILVIGDASMIRDDFLRGVPPFGLPRSVGGLELYQNALDWLALDTDLVELRNKRDVDRKLIFVETDPNSSESIEEMKARAAAKKKFWRWLNILAPVVVLLGTGAFIWSKRSAEKRSFLAGQQR